MHLPMSNSKRRALEAQLELIYNQATKVAARLDALDNLPEEPESPFDDGTQVVYFQLRFRSDSPVWYNYVAVKARGLWYTSAKAAYSSGRATTQLTWDDLIDWITSQHGYRVYVVDGMSLIVTNEDS